jgi:hypothetical protein
MATEKATNFIAEGGAAHGFETLSASIGHGVNVQGTECGVYGESLKTAGARIPPAPHLGPALEFVALATTLAFSAKVPVKQVFTAIVKTVLA